MKLKKNPKHPELSIPLLNTYASLPSMAPIRWIFLACIKILEENERLKLELSNDRRK